MGQTSVSKVNVLSDLKEISKILGHSPQGREIPNLSRLCRKYFGSFNEAKLKAGLSIKNRKVSKFPVNAFRLDKDLASIVSHITFDGHLYKSFRGTYFSSKNLSDLRRFDRIMKRKFGISGSYKLNKSGSHKQTHVIYYFNKKLCLFLFESGTPKGNKAAQAFDVPDWIKGSREFSREYLKIAYLCEGSLEKEIGRKSRISFVQSKCSDFLDSGLNFMESIKSMLRMFEIDGGESYVSKEIFRRTDGKISHDIRFRIKTSDSNNFIREIGWLK